MATGNGAVFVSIEVHRSVIERLNRMEHLRKLALELGGITHVRLVRYYALGFCDDPTMRGFTAPSICLLMEPSHFADQPGISLHDLCRSSRLTTDQIITYAYQLLDAIKYLHDRDNPFVIAVLRSPLIIVSPDRKSLKIADWLNPCKYNEIINVYNFGKPHWSFMHPDLIAYWERYSLRDILAEKRTALLQLNYTSVVQYLAIGRIPIGPGGMPFPKPQTAVLMEFCDGGTLNALCKEKKLVESELLDFLRQIASAISYLHNLPLPIFHGDIKGENIFLNSSQTSCKLGDMDNFHILVEGKTNRGGIKFKEGTLFHMSPEMLRYAVGASAEAVDDKEEGISTGIGRASDVWSVGCVGLEMVGAGERNGRQQLNSLCRLMYLHGQRMPIEAWQIAEPEL
ncbi:hypothetical protein BV898_16423 [Hypsibius exemplaris]|uniref:Protein kinase domain-containing protein n=1 Tax=Hypsibius exemplaris TaxID=2072580 RepID=A0A9X6RLG8_HYPEX|nr:hypothetical protein BV898_16423 [Hypsibius exemplaris]